MSNRSINSKYFVKFGSRVCLIVFLSLFIACNCSKSKIELSLNWKEIAPGVWKCDIGKPEKINLLNAAHIQPNLTALSKKSSVSFPFEPHSVKAIYLNHKLYLRFPLENDEQIYGLGLQFKNVNRRGQVLHLHVDHYGGKDNGRTHAPVPFYVSSKGYGVLINSARYLTFYVGTTVRIDSPNQPEVRDRNTDPNWTSRPISDAVEVLVPTEGVEVIIFGGESLLDVVSRYNLYCGGGFLPPKWGLGFIYRMHRLYSADDVLKEVEEFEKKQFPLDIVGLEPGWMSASYPCTYEWDPNRFPNPKRFVQSLLERGIRINLWLNPYVSPHASLYKSLLPFAGSHSVWTGIVPDYSMEKARSILKEFFWKNHLNIGVSGVKIDEVDGYDRWLWPDVATFPSGIDAEQLRQTYGLFLQRLFTELYRKKGIRTFGLVRASNAGASSFPFVIYNDYYSHQDFITALVNSSFCGILWTPEVRSSKSGEEWLRRMQSVCFSPMAMINAWSSGTKPWSFPEVYEAVKEIATLRLRLLPYIYSIFAQYYFEGIPPIRAMNLEEGFIREPFFQKKQLDDTENPYEEAIRRDIKDQYMFGPFILVAPMFAGQKSRQVILPKGKWYNFYTGKYVGNGEIIEVTPGLSRIPLFVKDGGIIPMIPSVLHVPGKDEIVPLELRYYGESEGAFLLYDDDGESFDYEKGEYSWTKCSVIKDENGKLNGRVQRIEGKIFHYKSIKWKFMSIEQ